MTLQRLRVVRIEGRDFRNYASFSLEPDPGFNVIRGRNAQGKSNFIEALHFALRGFTARTSRADEVVRWGTAGLRVKAELEQCGIISQVACTLDDKGKKLMINGSRTQQAEFAARFGCVLFTPDDMFLLKGGPQERRRLLDAELSSFSPGYPTALQEYRRALAQRNALLRTSPHDRESLELWTERVTALGGELILHRLVVLRQIAPLVEKFLGEWGQGEEVSLRYRSSAELTGLSRTKIVEDLRLALERSRAREMQAGQTLAGPHRDDMVVLINGKDARQYASQGQQRSIILALKLCQIDLWRGVAGETPVVLLDDVFFELDTGRRDRILERLGEDAQVFVTVGDERTVAGKEGRMFTVAGGVITQGEGF